VPTIRLNRDGKDWRASIKWAPDQEISAYGFTVSEAVKELGARIYLQELKDIKSKSRRAYGLDIAEGVG
jgi:hypothetical protein